MQSGSVVTDSLGNICVTCHLLPASPAPACLAVITNFCCLHQLLLPAPTFTSCVNLPPGEYDVDLKDVNSFGYAEIGVAYHIRGLVIVDSATTHLPGACMLTIFVELNISKDHHNFLIGAV